MKILDAKGRLFGKVSLLDIGAGLVILMVLAGIFIFPGTGGLGGSGGRWQHQAGGSRRHGTGADSV